MFKFKMSEIETFPVSSLVSDIASSISELEFDVNIGKNNNKQITTTIDQKIAAKIGETYRLLRKNQELMVFAEGEEIGKVDLAFQVRDSSTVAYVEIEKSNKKTLWFDYVKLASKAQENPDNISIVICPKNYAHKLGTWNLYKEAVLYRSHLARLANNDILNRISIIGYTQYARFNGKWKEFSPEIIKQLKVS